MKREHLTELKSVYRQDDMVLFVGAGVSMSCGLPSWAELARDVTRSIVRGSAGDPLVDVYRMKYLERIEPLESMRYLRSTLGQSFKHEVSRCLYSGSQKLSDAVRAIVLMRKIRQICCFNYDAS